VVQIASLVGYDIGHQEARNDGDASMKFVEISGAVLLKLAEPQEVPQLRAAGVTDESKIRINPQGDIEILLDGTWGVIGGLLGDYESRIKKLTGRP
jgi:hypothetical protein